MAQRIYGDRVKVGASVDEDIVIDGDAKFDDSNNSKIDQAARQSSSELESMFKFYLSSGTIPIPDASIPDWFVELNNQYMTLLFWKIVNGTGDEDIKRFQDETIPRYMIQFQLPFKVSTNG